MIICGYDSVRYVNLAVIVRTTADVPVAADGNLVDAAFYRVDPNSGGLALDLLVGTGGHIALTAVPGVVGMYSVPVQLNALGFKQYHVVITYAVSGSARTQLEEILLLSELDIVSANDESLAGGMALAARGTVIP